MHWRKGGVIYCPDGSSNWADHSFMTPTAYRLDENRIRIFGGLRDGEGVSRIGYLDVDSKDPSRLLRVSKSPVLDIGEAGNFDDNGVILGDVLDVGDKVYMYYVGFQLVKKVKFLAFSGLATSDNGGESFVRLKQTPVMDRSKDSSTLRAIHSVIKEDGVFKVWHSVGKGSGWEWIEGRPYPAYNIWYTESPDGIHFEGEPRLCIDTENSEYRIGRPRVYKNGDLYQMYYTMDHRKRNYVAGYAESKDGINWERMDARCGLTKSDSGWDSEMACYPDLVHAHGKRYAFYNGNDYGKTGVGYAELIEE